MTAPSTRQPRTRRRHIWRLLSVLLLAGVLLVLSALSLSPSVPHPGALSRSDIPNLEQLILDNSPEQFRSHGDGHSPMNAD